MGTATKSDNSNLPAKLDLRRYFLEKYNKAMPPRVIDACQGDGHLWQQLRREYKLGSYWGLDLKPKPGRLKLASERVLAQPGWAADIIDVNTYGSPWRHWKALLPHVTAPLTIFLTIGQLTIGGGNADRSALAAMGLRLKSLPNSLGVKVIHLSVRYALALAFDHRLTLAEAVEAEGGGTARYVGVRLEPR